MRVFASHNPDFRLRSESSSGGVFSLIAEKIINEGGVVYGAAFDDKWNVVHRRIDSIEGLALLRGSKYVFSQVGEAYMNALRDLLNGRKVLFSGTPCQIAAMRKQAGVNPRMLLVEIVCHGAPQSQYWTRYLYELCNKLGKQTTDITSINFRDKNTGWKNYSFTIKFADGMIFTQPHDDNLYLRAFLQDLTLREPCFRCPFKYPNGSQADITLGDFWGISEIAPEIDNDLGTSFVIIKNQNKEESLKILPVDSSISFEKSAKYNPAIITSPQLPTNYKSFHNAAKNATLIPVLKKYAGRSMWQTLYLYLARLKNRLIY